MGLVAQAFGLTVLYWLLRNPGAIETVAGAATGAFTWLAGSTGGVPAPAPASVGGDAAPPSGARRQPMPDATERWRGLVSRYFPAHAVPKAMEVLWCESRGVPTARNPTSGASGLFQHMPQYFAARAAAAGFPGANIMDPEANVAAAAWLWRREGWGPWACA